jgi:hypothetical protein
MGLLDSFLYLFNFLSSFLGTVLIAAAFYFFIDEFILFPFIIGLVIITILVFLTRVGFRQRQALKSFARQKGMSRRHAKFFARSAKNKFFSSHIARAFLLGFMFFTYNPLLIIPLAVFCSLVILTMMRFRQTNLLKVILSSVLGTLSGVIGVIFSNFVL